MSTVDVTAHGAVGDGGTVDDRAITEAIAAAGPGGVVVFPGTTHLVARALRPLSGQVWLLGGSRLVRAPGSADRLVQADTVHDWQLEGGIFDGDAGRATSRCTSLVSIESGSTGCVVRGATFLDTVTEARFQAEADSGIRLVDSSDCRVERCRGSRLGYLVVCGSDAGSTGTSQRCTMADLVADTITANVVFVSGSLASTPGPAIVREHVVRDVVAGRFWDAAVEIGQGALDCVVSGIRADGGGVGQHVVLVRDNHGTRVSDVAGLGMRPGGGLLSVLPMYGSVTGLVARDVLGLGQT